ncbi:uncharacterized protein LOC144433392 [Glandiceps talaboti]
MAGHDEFGEEDIVSARTPSGKSCKRKKVGGYILGHTLGAGSFAKVCLGTHILTEERVAIKVIDKRLVAKSEYVKRNLRREAAMLQRLNHPNIIQLFEVLETNNNYYLILEVAEGGDFMQYLCDKKKFTERETRKFMRQLVSAVDHMHQADIIHRDIKIENFLLDNDYNLKLIDFGLSNKLGPDGLLQTQCGSPAYAAPEIFCNTAYGPGVDVWSMGINMYAMLTGELPFKVNPPSNMFKLRSKMLKGCDIPYTLTKDCKDLLGRMLEPNESLRIKVREMMKHPWLNRGYSCKLFPSRFPNKLNESQLDETILSKMAEHRFDPANVIHAVIENKPVSDNASYHLMMKRLLRGYGYPDVDTSNVSEEENESSAVSNTSTLRSTMDCSKWNVVRKEFIKPQENQRNYYDRTKGLRDVAFARKLSKAQSERQQRRCMATPTKEEVIDDMVKNMEIVGKNTQLMRKNTKNFTAYLPPRSQTDIEGMYYIQFDNGLRQKVSATHRNNTSRTLSSRQRSRQVLLTKFSPESANVTSSLQAEINDGGNAPGQWARDDIYHNAEDEYDTMATMDANEQNNIHDDRHADTSNADRQKTPRDEERNLTSRERGSVDSRDVNNDTRKGQDFESPDLKDIVTQTVNHDDERDDPYNDTDMVLRKSMHSNYQVPPLTPIEAVRRSNTFIEAVDDDYMAAEDFINDSARNGCIIIVNGQIKDERLHKSYMLKDQSTTKPHVNAAKTPQYGRYARTSTVPSTNKRDSYIKKLGMYYSVPRPPRSQTVNVNQSVRSVQPYYQPVKRQRPILVPKTQTITQSKTKTGANVHERVGAKQYSLPVIYMTGAIPKPS